MRLLLQQQYRRKVEDHQQQLLQRVHAQDNGLGVAGNPVRAGLHLLRMEGHRPTTADTQGDGDHRGQVLVCPEGCTEIDEEPYAQHI